MVIQIVDIQRIAAFKLKDDSPVPRNFDRMVASQVPLQRVETKPGGIHIGKDSRRIKQGKNLAQAFHVGLVYASGLVILIECGQTFVAKVAYHVPIIPCYVSGINREGCWGLLHVWGKPRQRMIAHPLLSWQPQQVQTTTDGQTSI
jgi:hypothetical protein